MLSEASLIAIDLLKEVCKIVEFHTILLSHLFEFNLGPLKSAFHVAATYYSAIVLWNDGSMLLVTSLIHTNVYEF